MAAIPVLCIKPAPESEDSEEPVAEAEVVLETVLLVRFPDEEAKVVVSSLEATEPLSSVDEADPAV